MSYSLRKQVITCDYIIYKITVEFPSTLVDLGVTFYKH